MAGPYQSVQAPDGSVVQFPAGMSDQAIQAVMARAYRSQGGSAPAPQYNTQQTRAQINAQRDMQISGLYDHTKPIGTKQHPYLVTDPQMIPHLPQGGFMLTANGNLQQVGGTADYPTGGQAAMAPVAVRELLGTAAPPLKSVPQERARRAYSRGSTPAVVDHGVQVANGVPGMSSVAGAAGATMGLDPNNWEYGPGDGYAGARQGFVDQMSLAHKQRPVTSAVEEGVGSLATPGMGEFAGGAKTLGGAVLRSAVAGAGYGAAYGASNANNGEQIPGALAGGAAGAVVGAAAPPLIRGAARIGGPVVRAIQDGLTGNSGKVVPQWASGGAKALQTINTAASRDNLTVPVVAARASTGLPPAVTGGRHVAGVAGAVIQSGGPGSGPLIDAVNQAVAQAPQRVLSAVHAQLSVDPAVAAGDINAIVQKGQNRAGPLYQAATSDPAPVWNTDLARLAQRPAIKKAMNVAAEGMLNRGQDPATAGLRLDPDTGWTFATKPDGSLDLEQQPTAATWDRVYKSLGQTVQRDPYGRALPNNASSVNGDINAARIDLKAALVGDPATGNAGAMPPQYRDALATGADYLGVQDAFHRGQGQLFNTPVDEFGKFWSSLDSGSEQDAVRSAAARDILLKNERGSLDPGLFTTPGVQQKLSILFGPDKAADFTQEMAQQANENGLLGSLQSDSLGPYIAKAKAAGSGGFGNMLWSGAEMVAAPHVIPIKAARAVAGFVGKGRDPMNDPSTNAALGSVLSDPGQMNGTVAAYNAAQQQAAQQGLAANQVAGQGVAPLVNAFTPTPQNQ